ncbi:hypothetical protein ACFO26_05970 [Lactococcus nasutitermitis]|uniref:Uncharacterized protein n=1 Tax=Lactococcus nasutitermitis TaxID=1652957 RepID=A0ABV9JDB5_9LACT|nr:hypothetical protein [Lactococcus nasutitermitis]
MMNPNENISVKISEMIEQLNQKMNKTDEDFIIIVKSNLKILNSKKLYLLELLEQDKLKYKSVYEDRHQYDEGIKSLEATDHLIKQYRASSDYSEDFLTQQLGMTVQKFYKNKKEITTQFAYIDGQLANLQNDIDKANYMISKMEDMENEMLNLFSDEKSLDVKKIKEALADIQKLLKDDKLPE